MPDVTSIPTELWRDITTKACTDGGSAGMSLALTNKFFHAQSLSTRFHSVSLTSLARLEAFLTFLGNQPQECKPGIEHLYLSFLGETEPGEPHSEFWNTYSHWSEERQQKYDENVKARKEKWMERFVPAMTRLFALAGPHLRTLCILGCIRILLPRFPFNPLPNLKELTLLGGCELFMSSPSGPLLDSSTATPVLKFPSLQRLHVVRYFRPSDILADLVKYAPSSFTHLRFSGMSCSHDHFPVDLERCLGVKVASENDTSSREPVLADRLASLRYIIIHGNQMRTGGWCGTDDGLWEDMCDHFKAIAREVGEARGVEMVQMSRPWRRDSRWPDRLYHDWVDRIEGGKGCWVSSEEEEAQMELEVYYEDDPPISRGGSDDEDDFLFD